MNDQPCNEDSDPSTDLTMNDKSGSQMDHNPTTITNSSSPSPTDAEITAIAFHSGPLPTPGMLAEFDRVVPGLARKIVDRSELELGHRHKIEQQALAAKIEDQKTERIYQGRGQWMGFILAILFSGSGVYLVVHGYPKVGGTMATVTVVALVGVFITGQLNKPKQSPKNQEERNHD